MTVVKDGTENFAKLSGKKKKTRLIERDHSEEEDEVSDKSTIFAARNITREHMPSKREECGINILILVRLLTQSLNFLCGFVPF